MIKQINEFAPKMTVNIVKFNIWKQNTLMRRKKEKKNDKKIIKIVIFSAIRHRWYEKSMEFCA